MVSSRKITLAVGQHDVGGDVRINLAEIRNQVKFAKTRDADVVHFSECNLTGYAGIDFQAISRSEFDEVKEAIFVIQALAKELEISVIFGCHFFENDDDKPWNALFYVNQHGSIEARYYKRILAGAPGEMDHKFYSGGEQPTVFQINGIKCGMLICHEWRYPEFYREYKKLGVELLFHSWYDGGLEYQEYLSEGEHSGDLIMGYVKGNAANNYLWVSGSNTSRKESCFASFIARPDGRGAASLERNQPGVLIYTIDLNQHFEDPSYYGRQRFT